MTMLGGASGGANVDAQPPQNQAAKTPISTPNTETIAQPADASDDLPF